MRKLLTFMQLKELSMVLATPRSWVRFPVNARTDRYVFTLNAMSVALDQRISV